MHTDGFEAARIRSLERARKLDRGELLEPNFANTTDRQLAIANEVLRVGHANHLEATDHELMAACERIAEKLLRNK